MSRRLVQVALVALCLAAYVRPASAQVFTGRVDVTAKDGTGAILPGVTVELTGPQNQRAVTDTQGEAHFLNLAPGRYTVTATLSGFRDYKNDNVPVGAGSVIGLTVTMSVGGVTEAVNVQAETPVIETKRQTVSTNVGLEELQNIPSSRDPWVVLQTVPGIIVDRVNVGGAESGQQSNYQAKGAATTDNTWNMDGIAITDMAALGSSPTYYDFDMFQEMQVTTGGADPANPTPGVQLNFVLRTGTNNWRGSTRVYFENNDLQSDNLPQNLVGTLQSYNRMERYRDYGAEGGGPIVKDKFFLWGAYGRTEPAAEIYSFQTSSNVFAVQGPGCKGYRDLVPNPGGYALIARDCTTLENYSAKATANFSDRLRGNFTYFRGNKEKSGRGASASHPSPTTWNQTGPTDMFKFEANYTVSDRTFMSARYAYTKNSFNLEPLGGRTTQSGIDLETGVWSNSYVFAATERPQNNFQIEGNHFRGANEFKFGFGYRKASVSSQSGWPGGVLNIYPDQANSPLVIAQISRDVDGHANADYWSAFLGDQITRGRLTVNLGLRWDRQVANREESFAPGNPFNDFLIAQLGPEEGNLMGEIRAPAESGIVTWNSITPRVGLTYALDDNRKTIARASYAMFASQLLSARGFTGSPIPSTSTGSGYVYWLGVDANGDGLTSVDELIPDPSGFLGLVGQQDRIGDYKVPMTHEVLFGVEREVARNFGVSANVTWRNLVNFNWLQYAGVNANAFTVAETLEGNESPVGAFSVPVYLPDPDAIPSDFARVFEQRKGYSQRYFGLEIAATKRMSDNWMLRAGFSTNRHNEYFDGPEAIADPTPSLPLASTPNVSANVDGGPVVTQTAGSGKGNIFMVLPRYQFILTGAYQAKWGINLGMNYVMREGYSTPYYEASIFPNGEDPLAPTGKNVLLTTDVDKFRLPNVHSFDARVSKLFTYDRLNVHLDLDVFNLFNASTVLVRQIDLSQESFDAPREIMNPRIFRVGVRVQF